MVHALTLPTEPPKTIANEQPCPLACLCPFAHRS
jgi:hypothetical protein